MLGSLRATAGGNATPIVNSTQAITATSTIAITAGVANQISLVTSATAITLTSNPQLATGIAGQRVTIHNAGAGVITFTDGNGLSLQGTLTIGSTQFATFVNLGGFWQLEDTNGSPAWTPLPLINSFQNVGGFQNGEYTRFRNEVILRGLVQRALAHTGDVAIAVLPPGHRVSAIQRFPLEPLGSNLVAFIDLSAVGELQFRAFGTVPNPAFVTLQGIRFRV